VGWLGTTVVISILCSLRAVAGDRALPLHLRFGLVFGKVMDVVSGVLDESRLVECVFVVYGPVGRSDEDGHQPVVALDS